MRISVSVAAQYAGTASGKVTVHASSVTVCVTSLSKEKGSCVVPARRLRVGIHAVKATYAGPGAYDSSPSAVKKLKVTAG